MSESEFDFLVEDTKKDSGKIKGKKAKKDHLIVQNQYHFDIKKGDDLSEIPNIFYDTLKTEKVI